MNTPTSSINTSSISPTRAIFLYTLVASFLFFEMAVQVSPSVMAAELMQDLNLGVVGLGIMSGVYFFSYTLMQVPSGLLLDRFNPRIIISLAIVICTLGTVLFALSQTIYMGMIARLLMGAGSACAFVSVLVVVADVFPPKYFALLTGITQMLASLGAMSGQLPVHQLVLHLGWRNSLWVVSAIGAMLACLIWFLLRYQRHYNQQAPSMITIFGHVKAIIRSRQTWLIALYACLLWAPMSGFASLWGVSYLQSAKHFSSTQAAFLCSLMWLGGALFSPLLGFVSSAWRKHVLPIVMAAVLGAVSFALILMFNLPSFIIGLLLILSGGAAAGQLLTFSLVKENNHPSVCGTAVAFNNMAVVISRNLSRQHVVAH